MKCTAVLSDGVSPRGVSCALDAGHPGKHSVVAWGPPPLPAGLADTAAPPHPDAQEETVVEHVQNLRQLLVNLVQDMREAQATDYAPLVSWIDQVEAADKRALKALVQLTRAGRLLAPGVRAVRL